MNMGGEVVQKGVTVLDNLPGIRNILNRSVYCVIVAQSVGCITYNFCCEITPRSAINKVMIR